MPWLAIAQAGISLLSGVMSGNAQKKAAKSQSTQMNANADRRIVEGDMDAAEIRRQKRIVLGDARAIMTAQGGTSTSPQAVRQLGQISGASKHNELTALYEARMDAQNMRAGGEAVQRSGRAQARATYANSISTTLTSPAGQTLLTKGYNSYQDWLKRTPSSGGPPVVTSSPSWTAGAT